MNVSTDYVLYTLDDQWQAENANNIIIIKFAVSAVLFLVLAVVLQIAAERLLFKDKNGA